MELEIKSQARTLPRLRAQKREKNCIFMGSGDSYAACLAAQYASPGTASCCHPLDLVDNPASIAHGGAAFIVSISGKTKANILAARAAKKAKLPTVAITADPGSPLALSCDKIIQLEYFRTGVSTAGTASFTASLITCVSIASIFQTPGSIPTLLSTAEKQAHKVVRSLPSSTGSFLILGNGLFYPIAMYCAMKLNEVLGARAQAYPTEAFCHSPLFGLRSNDAVIILGVPHDPGIQLSSRLMALGINSSFVEIPDAKIMKKLLHSTFFVQALALMIAQRRGLKECYYLKNKKLLAISSDLIY